MNELDPGAAAAASSFGIVWLLIMVVLLVGCWKVFSKAGQPGWAVIIPIFNILVLLKIIGRPWWWLILLLIPLVNLVVLIILSIDLAKSFGQGVGFGLGLFLLGFIFYPLLGFGNYQYVGPRTGA